MARVYEVTREDDDRYRYRFTVRRSCVLMGVECPRCDSWAMTGIQYPSVDPVTLTSDVIPRRHLHGSRSSEPMTVEVFNDVAKKLAPILGPDRPVEPGAHYGPLHGKATGKVPDVAWVKAWTPLVRESVFRKMLAEGIEITGVPADIQFKQSPQESLIELEILPTARIHPDPPMRKCELCGRVPTIRGRGVDAATFNHSIPLQRVREWPTKILANEAMAEFVWNQNLAGADLTPIELK